MTTTVYHLNAFTYMNNGGNPAGVVLNAETFTEEQMQSIAAQVGFSETAFIQPDIKCDFNVRFFTPNSEVDFCGHATLATFALMFNKGIISAKTYTQCTKAGNLAVKVDENGYVEMNQTLPQFLGEIDVCEIAASLNTSIASLTNNGLPIEIISTGLADIIIPIQHGQLDQLKPDFTKIAELSKKYNVIGYQVFELTPDDVKFDANCRNFAPLVDIDEESATGSACGALASYFSKHQLLESNKYTFEQGRAMGQRSLIRCKIEKSGSQFSQVKVGGIAQLITEINL